MAIPTQNYGVTQTSGNMLTGEATIEMTPAMFNILSSQIYSDRVLAVIRESLCNAKDAQVDSGADQPIEVHLPSRLEPFFHIRDYGNGLSERQVCGYYEPRVQFNKETGEKETVQEFVPGLYLRYGLSTKTDTNEAIGGLGIGCKSPLAYSDSFLVESYQNGTCKTYSIYKENGKPQVSKLTQTMTTEPDGLKVKLAVKEGDADEFAEKTAKFLKFFGYPVEVKGSRHGKDFSTPIPLLETTLYSTYESDWSCRGEVSVLMGGVVYGLTSQYKERLSQIVKNDSMLLNFDIGELTVAASREGLSEDPQTVQAIEDRIKKVTDTFYSDIISQIEVCSSEYEAFKMLKKYGLISQSWKTNNTYQPVQAAEKLVVRGGKTIQTFIDSYKSRHRVISGLGLHKSDIEVAITSIDSDDIVLLIMDKKTGYLKVARKLADDGKVVVLLPEVSDKRELEAFFGPLPMKRVSVEYPAMFPKGERSEAVKVASSGLKTYTGVEVNTLEKEQEGYYIPYLRNECEMQGLYTLGLVGNDERGLQKMVMALVAGGVFTDDEVFFSRKAGMPAIKKTKLKELTAATIVDKIKSKVTKQDIDVFVQHKGETTHNPFDRKFKRLWEEVKPLYPLHAKAGKGGMGSKERAMLIGLPTRLLALVIEDFDVLVGRIQEAYSTEGALIKKENKLALSISTWEINDDLVNEMIAFSRFKRAKAKNQKKGD